MPVVTLDSLHSYAVAIHVLNRVLDSARERTQSAESLYFISVHAELEESRAGILSHDPAYWPHDWHEALGQTPPVGSADAYAGLRTFVAAFVERGCDDAFRQAIARLDVGNDGFPRDREVLRWWTNAWELSARDDVGAAVRMTRSPFVDGPRWRAGVGWTP